MSDDHVQKIFEAFDALNRAVRNAKQAERSKARQRSGVRVSRHPPFGWQHDPADRRRLIEQPEEQAVLRRILELHQAGNADYRIAKILEAEHILIRGRECWHPRTIKRILERALAP